MAISNTNLKLAIELILIVAISQIKDWSYRTRIQEQRLTCILLIRPKIKRHSWKEKLGSEFLSHNGRAWEIDHSHIQSPCSKRAEKKHKHSHIKKCGCNESTAVRENSVRVMVNYSSYTQPMELIHETRTRGVWKSQQQDDRKKLKPRPPQWAQSRQWGYTTWR
jgi:hypothetical protein